MECRIYSSLWPVAAVVDSLKSPGIDSVVVEPAYFEAVLPQERLDVAETARGIFMVLHRNSLHPLQPCIGGLIEDVVLGSLAVHFQVSIFSRQWSEVDALGKYNLVRTP